MRRAKLEGRRIGRAPLDIDRVQVVADRLAGMPLTSVAKKYHVSRATVCRLVNESGGLRKASVPQPGNVSGYWQSWVSSSGQEIQRRSRDSEAASRKPTARMADSC
jgi:transposase